MQLSRELGCDHEQVGHDVLDMRLAQLNTENCTISGRRRVAKMILSSKVCPGDVLARWHENGSVLIERPN